MRVHTKRGGETLCEFEEDKKQSALKRALLIPHSLFVFVLFYVLCFIICSSVSLSLSFVVVVVVVHISAFGRADSTELKNSILSVKKNVLNTHTRARTCALRACENFHREHLL